MLLVVEAGPRSGPLFALLASTGRSYSFHEEEDCLGYGQPGGEDPRHQGLKSGQQSGRGDLRCRSRCLLTRVKTKNSVYEEESKMLRDAHISKIIIRR